MNTLELLDKIAPNEKKRSRVESIRDMYLKNNFTPLQKRAIEMFVFEPTEEQAFKALKVTPKAWLFVRHVVSNEKIVAMVSAWIQQETVKCMYIRSLVVNEELEELLNLLLQGPCKTIIDNYMVRHMKKVRMSQALKR